MRAEESIAERASAVRQSIGQIVPHESTLSRDEKRLLEHFWNEDQHVQRSSVPLSVVHFIEVSKLTANDESKEAAELVLAWVDSLERKGYLKKDTHLTIMQQLRNTTALKLTAKGGAVVGRTRFWKHPIQWILKHKTLLQGAAWGAGILGTIFTILKFFLALI